MRPVVRGTDRHRGPARRLLRRLGHKLVFPAIEAFNVSVFRLCGVLRPTRAELLFPSGADRVLVVAPHADDETLGCGGTIGLHLEAGDEVCVAIVTDGGNSRAGNLERSDMVARRHEEAGRAVKALQSGSGGSIRLLRYGLPEGRWGMPELEQLLECLLDEYKPTIIYSVSRVDFHPEHVRVAGALASALEGERGGPAIRVRVYELQVPLTPTLVNLVAHIGSTWQRKWRALAAYRTQSGSFLWVRRHSRYLRALYRSREPVEVFWEMSKADFAGLHAGVQLAAPHSMRSIRLRPFSDLLAWIVGRSMRRALKAQAVRRVTQ
jgi:LmbE family N-acetylglucosaminyl deacetylase